MTRVPDLDGMEPSRRLGYQRLMNDTIQMTTAMDRNVVHLWNVHSHVTCTDMSAAAAAGQLGLVLQYK